VHSQHVPTLTALLAAPQTIAMAIMTPKTEKNDEFLLMSERNGITGRLMGRLKWSVSEVSEQSIPLVNCIMQNLCQDDDGVADR